VGVKEKTHHQHAKQLLKSGPSSGPFLKNPRIWPISFKVREAVLAPAAALRAFLVAIPVYLDGHCKERVLARGCYKKKTPAPFNSQMGGIAPDHFESISPDGGRGGGGGYPPPKRGQKWPLFFLTQNVVKSDRFSPPERGVPSGYEKTHGSFIISL
jgi:hypothetical protein